MGALSSVVSGLSTVASIAGTVSSLANNINTLAGNTPQKQQQKDLAAQQSLALNQLRAQQDASEQDAAEKAALQKAQIAAQAQSDDAQRQQALKRAVAAQRAAFGAQGVSSGDGSSEAVLLGLFDESDQDKQDRARIDTLRTTALNQSLAAQTGADVLQLSQLQQRQKLERELLSSS